MDHDNNTMNGLCRNCSFDPPCLSCMSVGLSLTTTLQLQLQILEPDAVPNAKRRKGLTGGKYRPLYINNQRCEALS
eukprot:12824-Eustigmatos_ZCMA.PRE.1